MSYCLYFFGGPTTRKQPFFNQNVFDYTSFATTLQLGFFNYKKILAIPI